MKFKLPFLLIPIVLITSRITCSIIPSTDNSSSENSTNGVHASCTTQSCNDAVKSMTEGIDPTVNPCDNFHQFTCGSYMSLTNYGNIQNQKKEFKWLERLSGKIEKELISSLEKDIVANDTEAVKFTKNLYQTCVNESAIEEQGLAPFLDMMEQVGGWPVLKENQTWNETAFDWNRVVFKIGNVENWNNILLPLIPTIADPKNLTQFSILVGEAPHRIPVNVLTDGINDKKVQNYFNYMVNTAVSMGASKSYATKELNETLHFETKLVSITYACRLNNDPNLYRTNYTNLLGKQMTISELMRNYSFIPWDEYIKHQLPSNVTIADVDHKIIVYNLNYINDLKDLIESTPKRVVANYIMWRNFDGFANYLPKSIRDIQVNYESTINANIIKKSRAEQCYEDVSSTMSLVMSTIYVREHFDKNTISDVNIILNNVQDEFVGMLRNAGWMDEETRNRSIEKAININRIIGYPKELLNDSMTNEYSPGLQFIDNKYVENIHISLIYLRKSMWNVFNPITLNEMKRWVSYGQIAWRPWVAFYNSDTNVLIAPAGSLQIPMYSYSLPMYMNYGKIGFFLGHEIGHSFDAAGRKLDKNNMMVNWLNATETKYNENAQCILTQYSNYLEMWTAQMSQIEDIADNIGIKAAYYAYKKLAHMDKNETIKGTVYTPQQMFWISYANVWCETQELDFMHSSSKGRVIGPLSNMKEFADDFNCPIDSPMNPSKKCQIF